MMATFLVWDYWHSGDTYYAIYEKENFIYFSSAKIEEPKKIIELLKKKPKIFSKEWLKKLFRKG
ncbi:MAG TPA: hypothetical protein VMV43_01635 [Candidatus Nanopelagicaceae bacterium]|nr:hypothetical protein [Candidatus Nanopelagicaceae bacterium]